MGSDEGSVCTCGHKQTHHWTVSRLYRQIAAMVMIYTDRLGASGFFNPAMGGDPISYLRLKPHLIESALGVPSWHCD